MKYIKLFEAYSHDDKIYKANLLWLVYYFKKKLTKANLKQIEYDDDIYFYREIKRSSGKIAGKLEIIIYDIFADKYARINDPDKFFYPRNLFNKIPDPFTTIVVCEALKITLGVDYVRRFIGPEGFKTFRELMKEKRKKPLLEKLKLFEAYSHDDKIYKANLLWLVYHLEDYIQQVKFIDDEKLRTWQGLKIGWSIPQYTTTYSILPSSQVEPPKGRYTLSVISIKKTDHYLKGSIDRSYFDEDDYDNWQTERLNMIKSEFDTQKREPIIVIEGADGLYSVIDGHHRLVIANELGRQSILALVIKNDTSKKLEWQDSLNDISKLYIKAKAGNLKWTKEQTSKFISWLENSILQPLLVYKKK